MAFTAQDVKKLREMTNVGMMDCKKALQATDGDMDKAVDWLREKGLAKAAKKADRIAAEGVAYATVINGIGVVIEVNSETDFAAKTDAFLDLVKNLAVCVAEQNPADVEALKACTYPNSNLTVTEIMPTLVISRSFLTSRAVKAIFISSYILGITQQQPRWSPRRHPHPDGLRWQRKPWRQRSGGWRGWRHRYRGSRSRSHRDRSWCQR